MRKTMMLLLVVVSVVGQMAVGQSTDEQAVVLDYQLLAEKLVNQCAGIHEGDLVRISGGVRDCKLLENLAVLVRARGAFPLITLSSDEMTKRFYEDIPEVYDVQTSDFEVKLASIITARIHVDYSETENPLSGVPPERIVTVNHANAPAWDLMLKRKVRQVYLGNDLYPTAERAQLFGVAQDELAKVFWNGVNVDYTQLRKTGEALRSVLAGGQLVHITHPGGTDLKMEITARRVFVSDGVVSPEDMQQGNAGCLVWLPAGEVYVTPVPETAEGKVVVERQFFQGQEIRGLELKFKAGKLVSMKAESGLEPLKAMYDAQGPGKDVLSVVDIGINPNVHNIPGSRMVAWMAAGTVTVGLGDNTWAGGMNNSPFEFYNHLSGATLKVDGNVLVEAGELVVGIQ